MGESKTRLQRLLERHPNCAYCGGETPATSRDHCPAVAFFDGAQRLAGLEFPACRECHEGTRQMDLVTAMMSRFLTEPKSPAEKADVQRLIRGFINNHRDLALLFDTSASRPELLEGREVYPIPIRDPERLGRILNAFAARMGLALYHEHYGRPAPARAKIATRWYSNVNLFAGDYPEELLKAIGLPRTLVAGKKAVPHQFRYWSAAPDETTFGMFAAFRESFGVLAIFKVDDDVALPEGASFLQPGFLKGFVI
jgi:hypothetical protein